ncbi:DUF2961 domain-containing protein [Fulvivirgaceae bacterium BMA10]|uniref:DUF2961 domain-containing protein n=1 Tax=Splendidivirga corallicola TaxID=3051826 RepID=A0ABT8KNB8_9BACT|nr:DUF2961 domain-containing protein [Fulvivirgaceae bacterium BMA10]
MKRLQFLTFLILIAGFSYAQEKEITMASLLEEMTDRASLSKWPAMTYTCKQASSYSRESKTRNTSEADGRFQPASGRDWGKGWFENHDFSQYIRTEENQGRKEDVMFEAEGPGAIVRFWATFGGVPSEYGGIYRVYIDDDPNPVIEMHNQNFAGKAGLVGKPFSFYAPEKAENDVWRGRNLFLPIPYGKYCKITYDGEHVYSHIGGWRGHYYQINYRTYEAGTRIESFSGNTMEKYKKDIEFYGKKLMDDPEPKGDQLTRENVVIQPGDELTLKLKGEKAITYLQTQLKAENQQQALRSTVLKIEFDGQTTVWCPVGQFFGLGYKPNPHRSYYIATTKEGNLASRWVMPFAKKATISLINHGEQQVTVQSLVVGHEAYTWDEQSMYFHAAWKETRGMETELRKDENYIIVKGKGVFVADNLTLFNSFPDTTGINWWGEGDEKIYVDNEEFPSHFGTGTEDYYCYAWCRPQWFTSPFASQPIGEGNKTPGNTSNNRYRLLDAIPFTSNFKFDMEIWHPYRAKLNYSPATFWYAFPDAEWNIAPDPQGVKKKVALKIKDVTGL